MLFFSILHEKIIFYNVDIFECLKYSTEPVLIFSDKYFTWHFLKPFYNNEIFKSSLTNTLWYVVTYHSKYNCKKYVKGSERATVCQTVAL